MQHTTERKFGLSPSAISELGSLQWDRSQVLAAMHDGDCEVIIMGCINSCKPEFTSPTLTGRDIIDVHYKCHP